MPSLRWFSWRTSSCRFFKRSRAFFVHRVYALVPISSSLYSPSNNVFYYTQKTIIWIQYIEYNRTHRDYLLYFAVGSIFLFFWDMLTCSLPFCFYSCDFSLEVDSQLSFHLLCGFPGSVILPIFLQAQLRILRSSCLLASTNIFFFVIPLRRFSHYTLPWSVRSWSCCRVICLCSFLIFSSRQYLVQYSLV